MADGMINPCFCCHYYWWCKQNMHRAIHSFSCWATWHEEEKTMFALDNTKQDQIRMQMMTLDNHIMFAMRYIVSSMSWSSFDFRSRSESFLPYFLMVSFIFIHSCLLIHVVIIKTDSWLTVPASDMTTFRTTNKVKRRIEGLLSHGRHFHAMLGMDMWDADFEDRVMHVPNVFFVLCPHVSEWQERKRRKNMIPMYQFHNSLHPVVCINWTFSIWTTWWRFQSWPTYSSAALSSISFYSKWPFGHSNDLVKNAKEKRVASSWRNIIFGRCASRKFTLRDSLLLPFKSTLELSNWECSADLRDDIQSGYSFQ